MIRAAIERFSRNVVLKRRLPDQFGGAPLFVSPDAALRFWRRDLYRAEPALFNWASEFVARGDVVWDIGANVGVFAFASAARVGSSGLVVALEPDTFLVSLLRRSAQTKVTPLGKVEIICAAAAERVGIAEFQVARRGRSTNHLKHAPGSTQTGGIRETGHVVTLTLDWLLETVRAPSLVKIDVEGAEYEVLTGAAKLLSTAQPMIICEVGAEASQKVGTLLQSYGYAIFGLDEEGNRSPIPSASFNTLACPARFARTMTSKNPKKHIQNS